MDDNKIPYIAFEAEMARHERTIKRLLTALVVAVALLFVSNVAWLWFFNQFDYASDMVTLDSSEEGNATYMGAGANGVVDNGRGKSQDN
jgi:hypothetical protein